MLFPVQVTCVLLCIPFPRLPQVLCFSTCPPDVPPHANIFLLSAAAVANKLFRHTVPEWKQYAAERHRRKLQLHSLRLKSCSCVTSLLKHLWLLSLHPLYIQLEFTTPNECGCCNYKRKVGWGVLEEEKHLVLRDTSCCVKNSKMRG